MKGKVYVGRPRAEDCYVCGEDVFYQGTAWWDAAGWQGGDHMGEWHNHEVRWVPPPRELEAVIPLRPKVLKR